MNNTFSHRGTLLRLIQFENESLKNLQRLWTAHLQNIDNYAQELNLPKDISSVIDEVNKYVTAVLPGEPIEV
jgi:hypothetical protein